MHLLGRLTLLAAAWGGAGVLSAQSPLPSLLNRPAATPTSPAGGSVNAPEPAPLSPPAAVAAVGDRTAPSERQQIVDRLRIAQRALDTARQTAVAGQSPPEGLSREVNLLKQIDLVIAQQETAAERKQELTNNLADLDLKRKLLQSGGSTEPYSFLLLDRLRDELDSAEASAASFDATLSAAQEAVNRAQSVRDSADRARRLAKEAAASRPDPAGQTEAAAEWSRAELEGRLAGETLELREAELANEKLAEQVHSRRTELLRAQVAAMSVDVQFTSKDLQDLFVELDNREDDLKRTVESAEVNASYLERQWFEARQRLDESADRPAELVEEVEARRMARQAQQRRLALYNQQLQRIANFRQAWQRRYKVISGEAADAELAEWGGDARRRLEQLDRDARVQQIQINELRKDLVTLSAKAQAAEGASPELARWAGEQRSTVQKLQQSYESNAVQVEAERRLWRKLSDEIAGGSAAWKPANLLGAAGAWAREAWNYEITSVEDRPITVRKIVAGLLLLLLGYVASRWLSRFVGKRLLPRIVSHENVAVAVETVMFYLFLSTFCLFALRIINVPLTAFTILGGAVAVGLGFGSQNILNNFISGLILLAERPVRVGDMIQVDGFSGCVEQIGARSTRIRTGNNLEIIVPNSTFLQTNVVNWTLSDDRARSSVTVGVAYGSPTRDVARLLRQAAETHGLVLRSPEPFVWFRDFGDNSLVFEVHFWLHVRNLNDRLRVESDLRFMIEQAFRDAGIEIAFPQRDVRLATQQPLEIRMLPTRLRGAHAGEEAA